MSAERRRRTALWGGTLLVAALLPVTGTALPAHAAGCQSEVPTPLPPSACDDTTPPETTLSPLSPQPNAAGWTRTREVTLTFAGIAQDASDTDEVGLECKLEGPSKAHDWQDCESPRTYSDLEDTPTGEQYTFSVRAYDAGDRPITFDDPMTPPPPLGEPDTDAPDEDATPATVSWKQDATAPIAYVFPAESGTPYDADGTGWPIAKKPSVSYLLDSSEDGVDYRCQLDGTTVACKKGENTFTGIDGGNHVLSVGVKDKAGNEDESPTTKQFVMPYNLTEGRFWKKATGKGWFAGDYLRTKRAGASIKFRARNIREFRIIAPAGPDYGKIRVRTGTGFWKTYDLSKGKPTKSRYIVVRDAASPLFSGRLLIESLARGGKEVRVDALVFPPGR